MADRQDDSLAGLVVRDRLGIRKKITRVAQGRVYWKFIASGNREYATEYEVFVGTHFTVAPSKLQQEKRAA